MTFSRTTTVNWQGSIMEGAGTLTAGTGAFTTKVSFPRRIGEPEGVTSPEELLAGSHAVCYAMVVTGALGRANATTKSTTVTCTVTADKGDAGINIVKSELTVVAEGLTGLDAAGLDALCQDAKGKCPISKALNPSIAVTVKTSVKYDKGQLEPRTFRSGVSFFLAGPEGPALREWGSSLTLPPRTSIIRVLAAGEIPPCVPR